MSLGGQLPNHLRRAWPDPLHRPGAALESQVDGRWILESCEHPVHRASDLLDVGVASVDELLGQPVGGYQELHPGANVGRQSVQRVGEALGPEIEIRRMVVPRIDEREFHVHAESLGRSQEIALAAAGGGLAVVRVEGEPDDPLHAGSRQFTQSFVGEGMPVAHRHTDLGNVGESRGQPFLQPLHLNGGPMHYRRAASNQAVVLLDVFEPGVDYQPSQQSLPQGSARKLDDLPVAEDVIKERPDRLLAVRPTHVQQQHADLRGGGTVPGHGEPSRHIAPVGPAARCRGFRHGCGVRHSTVCEV